MARPIRIEFPDAIYHVTARGNGRATVFETDDDRTFFLWLLGRVWDRYQLVIHAYCLMSTHYHLLAQTPRGNLGRAMQHLNGMYAQWFARDRDRPGHLWGGRYKAKLVEGEDYFLAASRYVVLNPVEAGLTVSAANWPWSSYRATVGEADCPRFFNRGFTLRVLDSDPLKAADYYRRLAGVPQPGPLAEPETVASPEFLRRLGQLVRKRAHPEATVRERHPDRPPLTELLSADLTGLARDACVVQAWVTHGYTVREMAKTLGCHPSTVGRIVRNRIGSERRGSGPA